MSDIVEVVDLTSPSPPRTTIALANSDANLVDSPTPSGLENRKARRRKSRKSSTNALLDSPASRSRNNSVERIPEPQSDRRVKRKRRSASPETPGGRENRRFRQDEKKPPAAEPKDIFFVDLTSTATPSSQETQVISNPENGSSSKLLLPSHVTVFGSTPVEVIPQPLSDSDDDGFIKYLDYDDARDTLRYYDEPPSKVAALDRTVCKNCGAEGEHKTSACPNQICLTCGARNEHSTRSCPISKVCFTCGMKGHINSNCPNRRTARALMSTRENECDRCSSDRHKTNECPTWWRLYEYLSGEDQKQTQAQRQSKKDMKLGQGGEAYVADDEWCYNCGICGHWGDDCYESSNNQYSTEEHSAFSKYNVVNSPFYDPDKEPEAPSSRSQPRDWEREDSMSGWGKGAPDRVGRQARIKSRAVREKQAQQVDDDPDDWFGNSAKRSIGSSRPNGESKKITFGKSIQDGGRKYTPPAPVNNPPSLLSRLGDDYQHQNSRSRPADRVEDRSHSSRNRSDRHARRPDSSGSSRYSDRRRQYADSGPRYKGGYAR